MMMPQSNSHHMHFASVVVWKRDKILVMFNPENNKGVKYDLPMFVTDPQADKPAVVKDEMRKGFRLAVNDVIETGINHSFEGALLPGGKSFMIHHTLLAADYQTLYKDSILTIEQASTIWMSARVAHALFTKHHKPNSWDGHLQYLSKFL